MDNLLHFFISVTIKNDLSYITMHLSINHCIAFNLYLSYKCMYRIGWGKINDFDFFDYLNKIADKLIFMIKLCILHTYIFLSLAAIPGTRIHGTCPSTTTIGRMCRKIATIPSIDTTSDSRIVNAIACVIPTMIRGKGDCHFF